MELVRTWKKSESVKGTHFLERAKAITGQDMEQKQASKGHSPTGGVRVQDWSGYRKKGSQQGVLTCWRRERLAPVRTWKELEPSRDTHFLERTKEVRDQDWSGHRKKISQQGALTFWRGYQLGLVRTWKESDPARGTHILGSEE